MNHKTALIIKLSLVCFILILLYKTFYPSEYNVPPFKERARTQYWNLESGSRIGYTLIPAIGPKKEYSIIYLHGGPGGYISKKDIQVYGRLADVGYDVYLYDQIGSGHSGRLANIREYTVDRHLKDLKEIIDEIAVTKVILIGQSWGSILAALFITTDSDKVAGIVFTSPGPIFPMNKQLANIISPDSFHLRDPFFTNAQGNAKASNLRSRAMKFVAYQFGNKLASDKEADEFATYLNYEVNKSTVCDTSNILKADGGSGYYASIMTFKSLLDVEDHRAQMKGIKIPVLVLKGQCDNQKWGFTNEYLEIFQNNHLVIIPEAGHFIPVEQPDMMISNVKKFLINNW